MKKTVYFQHTPIDFIAGMARDGKIAFLASHISSVAVLLDKIAENPAGFDLVFKDENEMNLFIEEQFCCIEAAGGIVMNPDEAMLFIFRRGKWDLPKGKKEMNENEESCARREIEEETGIVNLNLRKKLTETYHVYPENGRSVFKTSHWYLYEIDQYQEAKPQTEEEITSVSWFKHDELDFPLSNTYDNIKAVVSAYLETAN